MHRIVLPVCQFLLISKQSRLQPKSPSKHRVLLSKDLLLRSARQSSIFGCLLKEVIALSGSLFVRRYKN